MKPSLKQQSFADAYEELERITDELESDSVDLDTAIEKFERGLVLSKYLKTKLRTAEQRVEKIRKRFDEDESPQGDEPVE